MNRTTAANGPAAPAVEAQAEPGLLDRVVEATQAYRYSLAEVQYMAKAAAMSDMFGMSEAQAFVLMMIAEARGMHPIEAVQRYHVIHKRPAMKAEVMLAEMIARGWIVDWLSEDDDPNEQIAMWSHPRRQPTPKRVGFTRKQAEQAELKSDLWRKYPANMLRARAISNAVRKFDPGVTVGIYTPEEIADMDDRPSTRPSPRPLPADAPMSRPEPAAVTPEAPVEPTRQAAGSLNFTGKDWVQALVNEYEGDWAAFCVKEGKPHTKLVENIWQAINGVVSQWVEDDPREKERVEVNGKRKKGKVAVRVGQAFESDRQETEEDFRRYLDHKWGEAATALGINMDSQPAEEAPSNA